MTSADIRSLLKKGEALLVENGVPNARRNTEWILCDALGCRPIDLYARSGDVPPPDLAGRFWDMIRRRASREPLQYILGRTEFMSLPFNVGPGVFVPRPDTEALVELAERRLRVEPLAEPLRILDLCCGSGVIAVSLASRIPNLTAIAVDVDDEAVATTRANAEANGVADRVTAVEADASDFLGETGPDRGRLAGVVCNPPYVESAQMRTLPPEVRDHEPPSALDGGPDGLDFYRKVLRLLPEWIRHGGFAAFEIGDEQGDEVRRLFGQAGFRDVIVEPDYTGRDRVVAGVTAAERR